MGSLLGCRRADRRDRRRACACCSRRAVERAQPGRSPPTAPFRSTTTARSTSPCACRRAAAAAAISSAARGPASAPRPARRAARVPALRARAAAVLRRQHGAALIRAVSSAPATVRAALRFDSPEEFGTHSRAAPHASPSAPCCRRHCSWAASRAAAFPMPREIVDLSPVITPDINIQRLGTRALTFLGTDGRVKLDPGAARRSGLRLGHAHDRDAQPHRRPPRRALAPAARRRTAGAHRSQRSLRTGAGHRPALAQPPHADPDHRPRAQADRGGRDRHPVRRLRAARRQRVAASTRRCRRRRRNIWPPRRSARSAPICRRSCASTTSKRA